MVAAAGDAADAPDGARSAEDGHPGGRRLGTGAAAEWRLDRRRTVGPSSSASPPAPEAVPDVAVRRSGGPSAALAGTAHGGRRGRPAADRRPESVVAAAGSRRRAAASAHRPALCSRLAACRRRSSPCRPRLRRPALASAPMADTLDIDAMIQRFRDRAAAVKQRPLPPVAGAERQRFLEQAQTDFQDFAIIGDADGARSRTACWCCGSTSARRTPAPEHRCASTIRSPRRSSPDQHRPCRRGGATPRARRSSAAAWRSSSVSILHWFLDDGLSLGPRWLVPAVSAVLLVRAVGLHPHRMHQQSMSARVVGLIMLAVLAFANVIAGVRLVSQILGRKGGSSDPLHLDHERRLDLDRQRHHVRAAVLGLRPGRTGIAGAGPAPVHRLPVPADGRPVERPARLGADPARLPLPGLHRTRPPSARPTSCP